RTADRSHSVAPDPRERSGDREREARLLEVDEQRASIGREVGAGELTAVAMVAGEQRGAAVRGDGQQMLDSFTVLAQDQSAPRRDGDVVRSVGKVCTGAL